MAGTIVAKSLFNARMSSSSIKLQDDSPKTLKQSESKDQRLWTGASKSSNKSQPDPMVHLTVQSQFIKRSIIQSEQTNNLSVLPAHFVGRSLENIIWLACLDLCGPLN